MRSMCISLMAVLAGATAAAETSKFTPYDVAVTRTVLEVAISPSGELAAYTLLVPREPFADKDGGGWRELHVVDASGTSRPFVTGHVSVGGIAFTPDGRGIAFLAKRAGDSDRALYVIPVDGGEAEQVLTHDGGISKYSYSGDGNAVAYLARVDGDNGAGAAESKGFNQEIYEEDRGSTAAWVARLDNDAKPVKLAVEGSAMAVHHAPKGGSVAVSVAPTSLVDDRYMRQQVHVFDAGTGKRTAVIANPGKLGQVAWSTNGKRLALVSAADLNDPRAGRILVASAKGGAGKLLLGGYKGHVNSVIWRSADTIVYVADEGTSSAIGQLRADGSKHVVQVPAGGAPLSRIALAADGKTYVTAGESPMYPREVFRGVLGKAEPKRLTHHNKWLSDREFGAQEVVAFKARDGLELEGILIKPLGYKPGVRYPLVMHVHGGPESHVRNGWVTRYAYLGQLGASRGFMVFYPNYRGSTARGVAFSKLSQADAAGGEFDDLVDAADHLVATGLVDTKRVGMSGGSYGGYATAWAATRQTKRFAAGVMFVGISNKISKAGTTDIPNEEFLVHTRKRPWKDWKWFLERSPIYYVEQARTPLLIAHGRDDPRVNKGQSMELYRHLKVLGKTPVRLVF